MMRGLKQSQDAARRQQSLQATKGRCEIARRMDNIGRNDYVEGAATEPLFLKIPVDVKETVMDKPILAELASRPAKKEFGEIGEPVLDLPRRQHRKDRRSGAPRSTTNFENSHTAPFSRNLRGGTKSGGDDRIDIARLCAGFVKSLRQGKRAIREQRLQRAFSSRQHVGKQHAALFQIGKGTRVVLHPSGGILPEAIKAHWLNRAGRAKLIACLNEDAVLRQS